MKEFDYEEIPFVFSDELSSEQPSTEELAIVAATLHQLFPCREIRTWDIAAKVSAIQSRLQ